MDRPVSKKVTFQELVDSSAEPPSVLQIPDRGQFLRDWPAAPIVHVSNPTEADPFPLFNPTHPRYFDQNGEVKTEVRSRNAVAPFLQGETTNAMGVGSFAQGDGIIEKRFAYSHTGTIKDFYYSFAPLDIVDETENLDLSDQVNRRILDAVSTNKKPSESRSPPSAGETDGWDEDQHTSEYWTHRMREVDYFVKNDLWSVDPIGDWSFFNENMVPKHFLRKLRRYFEIRPLEYLRDTGSYRLFHVLNQYTDLKRYGAKTHSLKKARKMELDYLAMVWLAIWDPKLHENIWQLKEMTMNDWFFSRVGWNDAISIKELLTKNELHAMDSLWAHRANQLTAEENNADIEELEEWVDECLAVQDEDTLLPAQSDIRTAAV